MKATRLAQFLACASLLTVPAAAHDQSADWMQIMKAELQRAAASVNKAYAEFLKAHPSMVAQTPPDHNGHATGNPVIHPKEERPAVTDDLVFSKLTRTVPVAQDNGRDPVGAFRFLCGPGHLAYNDPLVYPGQEGASHLHQFFGNLEADHNSTYESLRKSGDSTCMNPLNRSAYWIPALLTGKGTVHTPERLVVYYKALPSSDPFYSRSGTELAQLPRGLAYVFGWDANRKHKKHWRPVNFRCIVKGSNREVKGTMRKALDACAEKGGELIAGTHSPSCWNGKDMTASDQRSHLRYEKRNQRGEVICPKGFDKVLPAFSLQATYAIEKGSDVSGYEFASDHMVPAKWREPGYSFHADWFGAWNDETLRRWHEGCIEAHRNCSDGNLGDGTKMKWEVPYPHTRPVAERFVPIPKRPG